MAADGITRAACFLTSAYSSYSGCRQYRENLADAVAEVEGAPRLDRLRQYFNHPGFVEPVVDATLAALADLPERVREGAHLIFVTHSIPESMNESSGRSGAGLRPPARERDGRGRRPGAGQETGRRNPHALVYCSRSGPPQVPWLEPDVNDHLEEIAARAVPGVVLIPIGFVSDHMEVIYDLDTEALATAAKLDLPAVRAATPGVDPRFVAMVRDLLVERSATERGRAPDARPWAACRRGGTCAGPAAAPTRVARARRSAASTREPGRGARCGAARPGARRRPRGGVPGAGASRRRGLRGVHQVQRRRHRHAGRPRQRGADPAADPRGSPR